MTFIPDRALVYSEDLDRGGVFISQQAARTLDEKEGRIQREKVFVEPGCCR